MWTYVIGRGLGKEGCDGASRLASAAMLLRHVDQGRSWYELGRTLVDRQTPECKAWDMVMVRIGFVISGVYTIAL